MPSREHDVVLYGATGYTGRLVAHDLADQGADFAIAGRSQERLDQLAQELEPEPPTIQASIKDTDALIRMAEQATVLASAAGPFKHLGPPVLEAAIETGTHFVDTTGEQGFLRWAHQQHDRAQDAGITVINATGFDVIPSDMAAHLAAGATQDPHAIDLALATNSRLSEGTQRTMAATTGEWWEYKDGAFTFSVPGRHLQTFVFPGREEPSTGVFIPWGDVATAPRTTGADNVRTFFTLPEKRAKRYHRVWPLYWAVGKIPFLGRLLEKKAPSDRDGPSREDREDAWFSILAEAHPKNGDPPTRALVQGKDPYGLTGAATSRLALALAQSEVHETGVLTPTQAFEPDRIAKLLPEYIEDAKVLDE